MSGGQDSPYGEQPHPQQGAWQQPGGYGQYPPPAPGPGQSPAGHPQYPGGPLQYPGQPATAGQQWGFGQQSPPPPHKSNTGLVLGLIAGAVVLLGIIGAVGVFALSGGKKPAASASGASTTAPAAAGGTAASSPSASPTAADTGLTISLPSEADGYTHTTGNVAQRTVDSMRAAMTRDPAAGAFFANAELGMYSKGDAKVVFIGAPVDTTPALQSELQSQGASTVLDSFMNGAGVSTANDYPTGPFGGALRCGAATNQGVALTLCAWVDHSVFGCLIAPNIPPATLAPTALAFRTAAEH